MKQIDLGKESSARGFSEVMELVGEQWRKNPLPIQIFLLLCLNLLIAPAVDAAMMACGTCLHK
jgi:hypothetical protein